MSVLGVNGRPKSCPPKLGGSVDVDSLQPTTVGAIHEPLRLKPGGYPPFESDEKECHAANDLWPYRGIPRASSRQRSSQRSVLCGFSTTSCAWLRPRSVTSPWPGRRWEVICLADSSGFAYPSSRSGCHRRRDSRRVDGEYQRADYRVDPACDRRPRDGFFSPWRDCDQSPDGHHGHGVEPRPVMQP